MPGTAINGGPNAQLNTPSGTALTAPTPYTVPTTPTISSAAITPQTPLSVIQPTPPPVYNTAGLAPVAPPLTETPAQSQESSLTQQLSALTNEDAGKSQFTADQYKALGIGMTYDANGNIIPDSGTADLSAKLAQLKNEALAIPIQGEQAAIGLRSEAGQAPITASAQRQNAIDSLTVSSAIDAANGNLATAEAKVNQAVIQKYGPIEAQMAALKANLANIIADPNTTIEEKNQAQAQTDSINAQTAAIADAKTQQTAIWTVATDAAANTANFIPSQTYPTVAIAITAIQNAHDKATALAIATGTGLTKKASTAQPTAVIQEYEYAVKNGYKGSFPQYQGEVANLKDTSGTWSAPYAYQGNTVQRNSRTGEIRTVGTAVNQDTTNTVNNIVDGSSSFSDVQSSDANYENVKAQLTQLGFYSDTPPSWYVKAQNDQSNQNILPTIIQSKWSDYRKKALGQ
jgi:hypothetical protein